MKPLKFALPILLSSGLLSFAFHFKKRPIKNPYGLKMYYDTAQNTPTKEGFLLGRALFYDNILSRDSSINCSSCHLSVSGFTHIDHALSHGVGDSIGNRNSIALMNLLFKPYFMWDGAATSLEAQPLIPLSSHLEMDLPLTRALERLNRNSFYRERFHRVFHIDSITTPYFLKAFAQFLMQLNSFDSKYDQVMRNEAQFSAMEERGYRVFKRSCASCHNEPLFTNLKFATNGIQIDSVLNDHGREEITQNPKDRYHFAVPTLRNIMYTFPYMHDGRFELIKDVLNHYSHPDLARRTNDKRLSHISLKPKEKTELIAFLKTLTDKTFLFNPDFRQPIP